MTNINTFQGTVGIGTNNPSSGILDVAGTLRVGDGTSGLINLGRSGTVANYRTGLIYHDGTDLKISNQEDGDLKLATNNSNKLILDSSGNVDITGVIRHIGDENNLFGFSGTDTFKIATGGADAIKVDASQNVDITGVIRHIGDENNLFGFSGTDTFKIATAGADRLTVKADGTVGIGTNTPGLPLETYTGNGANYGLRLRRGAGTAFTDLGHLSTPGTEGLAFSVSDGSSTTQEVMRVTGTGRVGIGTNVPGQILHLEGTIPTIRFVDPDSSVVNNQGMGGLEFYSRDSTGDGFHELASIRCLNDYSAGSAPDGTLVFSTSRNSDVRSGEVMRIDPRGLVGIGTTAPVTKLHLEHSGSAIGDFEGIRIANHATNLHSTSRPAYEFVVSDIDAGTGIGASKFAIGYRGTTSASRTDRLVIDSSGLVGIGTVTPRGKLDIYTGATTAAGLILDRYATGNYRTELYQGTNGLDIKVGHGTVAPTSVVDVERFSATSARLRIASPGCLRNDGGVETASYNDITNAKQIWDTGSRFRIFTDGDSKLLFSSAGGSGTLAATTALSVHNGGLVGINTASASRNLSVNGSFMVDYGGGRTFGTSGATSATPNDTTNSGTVKHKGTFFISLSRYTTATNRPIYFGSGDDSDTTVVLGTTGGAGGAGFQNTMLKLTGAGYLYVKKVYANNSELSDDRLKINEEPIQNATKTILKLNPLVYDKYEKLSDLTSNVFEVESGLMVQDVWYDTPELRHIVEVPDDANPTETKEEDPEYTNWGSKPAHLTYTQLLPYIIKSIQEIHNENGKLKIQISGAHSPNMIVCKSPTTDTVSLCNKEYDSTCIGVLSDTNSSEVLIETRGLGNIWVVNTNGNLTPGDYMTTSNVSGYGQKQNSEFLANYTVAKITEPCDFTDIYKPVKRIIQQLEDVNYYGTTKNILVNEEIYNTLPENERHIETCTSLEDEIENTTIDYFKILYTESKYNREGAETITRQELVNVLDEHGQIQWEDHPTETEKAYKIRYLDANGVITDEANVVHTAAFVGCTYHCG